MIISQNIIANAGYGSEINYHFIEDQLPDYSIFNDIKGRKS